MNHSRRDFLRCAVAGCTLPGAALLQAEETPSGETLVPEETMRRIYTEVQTPYKYGIVMPQEEGDMIDSGKVFRFRGHWYMSYLRMLGGVGYVARMARSDDLIHWEAIGTTMPFRECGWDAWQASPSPALVDYQWGGSCEIQSFQDRYWFTYIGGAGKGYEPDPLKIGLAWTDDPASGQPFSRLPEPIMSENDPDARPFEKTTLYQTNVMRVDRSLLGAEFLCFYNAKDENSVERIGLAVSDDMIHWRRRGDGPLIDNHSGISGDPQIVRIEDYWVMFYFGAFWQPKAFDTFAVSKDLLHWTKWEGEPLVQPSRKYDETYAHKPCVIKYDDVVYHFYCAVGDQGRCIALSTSKKI